VRNKFASPSAIQVKNQGKAIDTEGKVDVRSQLEKMNELLTYVIMLDSLIVSTHTVCDNPERIKENAKSGSEVFV